MNFPMNVFGIDFTIHEEEFFDDHGLPQRRRLTFLVNYVPVDRDTFWNLFNQLRDHEFKVS